MTDESRILVERPVASLLALFLSAAAWTAFVLFAWTFVPVVCDGASKVLLHGVAALTLAVSAAGLAAALRIARSEAASGGLSSFSLAALALSALFTAGVALFWVFTASFDAC